MRRLVLLLAGLWLVPSSLADVVSERPDKVTVTIYHERSIETSDLIHPQSWEAPWRNGLAFITETRTVDVPAGAERIEFRGVASGMVPQTADIRGLPDEILEQNFDYDLLSPGSLLANSIGRTVRVVRTDKATGKRTEETAIVRTSPSGTMLEIGGRFEAFQCSGGLERLVFDSIPEGLRDTPTLSVRTRAPAAGRYTVTLSYIATGMNWSADYVARIRPGRRTLDLTGLITLANFGDTGFAQVPVEVVAGHLETTGEDVPVEPRITDRDPACWPTDIDWGTFRAALAGLPPPPPPPPPPRMAPPDMMLETMTVTGYRASLAAQQLGDYKLYALPELSDLNAHQTKQVQFLAEDDVPFERLYTYSVDDDSNGRDTPATVTFRLQNTEAGKLGKPLPAGSISVLDFPEGSDPVLAGQDRLEDVSVGLPVEITTGKALDVIVSRKLVKREVLGSSSDQRERISLEITVSNGKPVPAVVEVEHPILYQMRVLSESERHRVTPKGMVWRFEMAPGERRTLRLTVEVPM